MPCNPNENQLNVNVPPPPNIPGFGIPFSPLQIPLDGFSLPTKLIEDFGALVQQLGALFPSGEFNPFPDSAMKSVFDFISNILSQIAPYLSLYNFFLALLNIIKCIIDVLCAIPNPFAVANKLIVLFTQCLPPFLNLFPIFALIAMIIALLLLILALIEYIILLILAIIEAILKNLEVFVDAILLSDAESILAAVTKIGLLLCFLENILAILLALIAIINIIKSLAAFAGVTFCSDEDEDGCCPIPLCPPFIKNTPDGISTSQGKLVYLKQIGVDVATLLGLDPSDPNDQKTISLFLFPPVRKERWQVYDKNAEALYKIKEIITPILPLGLSDDFWADEVVSSKNTSPQRAQYTVDLTLDLDPASYPNTTTDTKGLRTFKIKDCIVVEQPYPYLYKYNSTEDSFTTRDLTQGFNGVLSIAGGKVYEIDGYGEEVAYNIINEDGEEEQASLNTFLFEEAVPGTELPAADDSIVFDNIQFTWKPNAPALAGYNVTTFGCMPQVSFEKNLLNNYIVAEGISPVADKLPALPDIDKAYKCLTAAIADFRKDISSAGAAIFQAKALSCLDVLKTETLTTLTAAVIAASSQFKSDYTLDTDIQFTTRSIIVSVFLRDASGTLITTGLPESSATEISKKLSAEVSLGSISDFTYDGYSTFTAELTSSKPGDGTITVLFNSKVLSVFSPTDGTTASKIEENVKNYTFISSDASGLQGVVDTRSPVRRDETDVE